MVCVQTKKCCPCKPSHCVLICFNHFLLSDQETVAAFLRFCSLLYPCKIWLKHTNLPRSAIQRSLAEVGWRTPSWKHSTWRRRFFWGRKGDPDRHAWKDLNFFLTQVRLEALHSRLRLSCIMADKMSSTHKVSAFLLQTPCYLDPHHWVAGPGQLELPCGRQAGGVPTRESRSGGYSHSMGHLMLYCNYSHSLSLSLDVIAT